MNILIAASEAAPFVKTGGLAYVAGSLQKEFKKIKGIEACLMLPLYHGIREKFGLKDTGIEVAVPLGNRQVAGRIWLYGSSVYFIECGEFFDREEPYGTHKGDYPDNAARFVFFNRAVLEACMALKITPDVIHCNDWQAGLIPLYLKTIYRTDFFKKTAVVFTIHNIVYQGLFNADEFALTGLGREWFNPEGIEFHGKINFLKAGLIAADIVTTVSSTYKKEILTAGSGRGLEGVLNRLPSGLHDVINGIDTEYWDPETDTFIPANYSVAAMSGKAACKKSLIDECSLGSGNKNAPVIAMIGRLSEQKGLEILFDALDGIISLGAKLIMLGKGDEQFHAYIRKAAEKHKGNVFFDIGYNEQLSRRIYAGSDIFLMPSKYEPCGLGQLIAMRYGTIPVARETGGLADTITDYEPLSGHGTGFLFKEHSASSLRESVRSALCVYAYKKSWQKLVSNAMQMDFSWKGPARKYLGLYGRAVQKNAVEP